jgi:hypothetical protein
MAADRARPVVHWEIYAQARLADNMLRAKLPKIRHYHTASISGYALQGHER